MTILTTEMMTMMGILGVVAPIPNVCDLPHLRKNSRNCFTSDRALFPVQPRFLTRSYLHI